MYTQTQSPNVQNAGSVSILNFQGSQQPIDSPRTLEACLRAGFDPKELYPRKKSQFVKRGEDPDVARMKYQHFEKKRQEKIKIVIEEREVIMQYLEQHQTMDVSGTTTLSAAEQIKEQMEQANSTMVQMERQRLQKIQERMKKELSQMVESEEKMARIQKLNAEKEAKEALRREEFEAEKKKRRADMAEKRRKRQLEKQKKVEEEEKQRRELARQEAEQERRFLEEEERQKKIRQREAQERELERKRKAEQHRDDVERMLLEQEERAHESRLRMEDRERVIQEMMMRKKIDFKEKIREERRAAEKRISAALKSNSDILKKKRIDFDLKQQKANERARVVEERRDLELRAQAEKRTKDQQLAEQRKLNAYAMEEKRVTSLLDQRAQKEKHMTEVHEKRTKMRAMRKAQKDLMKEDKLSNVQRIKRIDEFVRLQTLQKIQDSDERSQRIKQEKQELLLQRKEAALESLRKKHEISSAMEKMRVTNKFDHSIEEALDPSKKGRKKKKRGRRRLRSSNSLPML